MAVRLGIGVAAGSDSQQLATVGAEVEALGFDSLWSNDNPAGDGLAQLAVWGQGTRTLNLGVGVLALDRHEPQAIATRARQLGIDAERLRLGVGPGVSAHPLEASREGVAAVRKLMPEARVVLAAMGPKMCRLAGEIADGVLLNWMTPERAAFSRGLVHEGAREAGRAEADVTIYGYVRVALGDDAKERLGREATMYAQMAHYARHFDAMGADPTTIGVAATKAAEIAPALQRWEALDVVVVRVLAHREPAAIMEVARAAAGAA